MTLLCSGYADIAYISTPSRQQAKKFVESCPQTLKENLPKDEAEKLKKTLEGLGATVSLE